MPTDDTLSESTVVELASELVGRPTPNPPGDEGLLVEYLIERLEASPVTFDLETVEVKPNRPNLVARAGDPAAGTLLLTGHMDTVPANAEDWETDPYELSRTGDDLIGRGTADMNCALAAKILAVESYLDDDGSTGEIVLAFTIDEERGGSGTQALVDGGVDADGAILGEPTDMNVGIAHKGAARYELTVYGKNSHSGRPDKGINAIVKLQRVLERLEALDEEMREIRHELLTPGSSVNVTEISGGLAPNVIPGKASVTVDWRFLPGMSTDAEWYDQRLETALEGLTYDGNPIDVEINRWDFGRAVESPPDSAVVTAVREAARAEGFPADLIGFNAGTDARYLVHDANIPTVLFGPGHIEDDAHTVDESIDVNDLVGTARTYRRAIELFFQ
ncbi:M20 family metallopeptidase [Natronorubrum sp. FCH18a]|uniref:M20 family metallopeptidase n=1 Tax=Natronorubrum sp. FCH18a TaxID=3447018 RepID=UPI003F5160E3